MKPEIIDPADIVADANANKRRTYDHLLGLPYTPQTAAKVCVAADIRVRIEPTPATENGPIVIDTPDTASARIYARELLHNIVIPLTITYGVTYRFRSDVCVEINHR